MIKTPYAKKIKDRCSRCIASHNCPGPWPAADLSRWRRPIQFYQPTWKNSNRDRYPLLRLGLDFESCHLLMKTGRAPIAHVMLRLLTGYAVTYNRRHRRHGHLFQNRYKSILCQEHSYLMELVRYIHLNPLRANIVKSIAALDEFSFSGHSVILGKCNNKW